jgi:hypothetical protein
MPRGAPCIKDSAPLAARACPIYGGREALFRQCRRLWGEALQASGPGLRTRACPLPFPARRAAIENTRKGEDLAVPASLSQPRASIWAAAACALTVRDGAIGAL